MDHLPLARVALSAALVSLVLVAGLPFTAPQARVALPGDGARGDVTLAWTPRAGEVLRYTLAQEESMRLVEVTGSVDTIGFDATMNAELLVDLACTTSFTDEVLAVADGRPVALRRTFEEIGGERRTRTGMADRTQDETAALGSPLEGLAVRFTRTAPADEWTAAWASEEEADEALLAHLSVGTGLSELLPPAAVAEGDEWDAGPEGFRAIVLLGHGLAIRGEDDPVELVAITREGGDRLLASLEGETRCRYAGERVVDGRELGVVELEVELASALEDSGEYEIDHRPTDYESVARTTFVLAGELLWDLAEGRAAGLDLAGTQTQESVLVETGSEDGPGPELHTRHLWESRLGFVYSVAAR